MPISCRRAPTQSVNRPWLEALEGRDLPALFGPSLAVSVGDFPQSVAVGDFNLDGIADLAVANRSDDSASVLLGTGTGAFTSAPGSPIPVDDAPVSIAIGDFNRDSIPDLAVANLFGGTVSVLLGTGTGAFSAAPDSPVAAGNGPVSVAVGDFNRDGIPDLAVINSGPGGNVSVLLGIGTGAFTSAPGSPVPVGDFPNSVAVGDFNRDGIPDLAVANFADDTVSVLLGTGTGAFTSAPGSPVPVGNTPSSAAVGDFNLDGNSDLAVANFAGDTVSVLLGAGTGAFTSAPGSPVPVGIAPGSVAIGDFNLDGIPDLAVANRSGSVSVLLGGGTGAFATAPGFPVPVGDTPVAMAIGDFNRDGIPDLAVANSGDNTVSVLLNQGGTTTALVSSAATALYGQTTTFTATVTAAGIPAGTVTFSDGTTVLGTVPLNPDGTATFTPAAPLPAGTHTIAATFNGSLEFVASSAAITQTVNLAPTTTILTTSTPQITAGDTITLTAVVQPGTTGTPTGSVTFYNGGTVLGTAPLAGGIATLPTATLGVGTHSVFALYASDGNFLGSASGVATVEVVAAPPSPPPPSPPPVTAFAAGADSGGGQVNLYNADGSFRGSAAPFGAGFAGGVRVAVGDVTGDGVPDLVAGTGPGAAAQVAVIDGKTGVSRILAPFESFTGGVFVAAGDLTGDGVADVVVTPDQGGGPRVVIYSGGDFQPVASFFGIDDPNFRGGARAAVGDIDNDGSPDLVVSAGFGGGPRVSVFDGTALARGQFEHPVADFFLFDDTLRNGVFLAVGDVDGDGFGDLVAGAGLGGGPRVLAVSGSVLLSDGAAAAVADPLVNFFAGDTTGRGGARVAVAELDGDARADLVVGDGEGAGSRVTGYLGKNFAGGAAPEVFSFDAFPGFAGGVFVG